MAGFRALWSSVIQLWKGRSMNGTLKLVLKLPPKAGLCADTDSHQTHKDLEGHKKKKRKVEGRKSGGASSADRNYSGAVPVGGAGIAGRQGATSQGIANGGAGALQPKPRISIKYVSLWPVIHAVRCRGRLWLVLPAQSQINHLQEEKCILTQCIYGLVSIICRTQIG